MYDKINETEKEIKKSTSDIVNDFLNDDEKIRDSVTVLKVVLLLGVVLLYFGMKNNFTLDAIANAFVEISLLGFIGIFGNKMLVKDFKNRAFFDEIKMNEELKSVHENINDKSDVFTNSIDLCIEFISDYNKYQQDRANIIKTDKYKNKLRNKMRLSKIKGKKNKAKRLELKLDTLSDNVLVDKRYRYIPLSSLVSTSKKSNSNKFLGKNSIEYNPKKGKWYMQLTSIFKFIGFGGGGSIAFVITDLKLFIVFVLTFVVFASYGCMNNYIKVRRKTSTSYLETQKNKYNLQCEMENYCKQKETVK